MRIAIVSADDLVGDDPQELCAALAAGGHEVTACVRRTGRKPAKTSANGYHTLAMPVGPRNVTSAADVLPFVGDWAATLEGEWTPNPPDVVHAYGWLGGLAAQLAARRLNLPTVQSFQGLAATSQPHAGGQEPGEMERMRIEPLLVRSASWVTGESAADVDALTRLRHGRTRVSVLTCGVDVVRYTPTGPALPRTDLHRIVCLAPNPLPHNGFDIVIGTLPGVPGAELVVAETEVSNRDYGAARTALQRQAAELGIADRVRFAGTVADDELPKLLRSADVVACTPREPPRATAVLQAMASAVVVIASPVGVLTDAVVDDVTGFLLTPESPRGLAAALRNVLNQRFLCESMGAAGRGRAISRFAWDRIALDALNIYRQIAEERSAPSANFQSARAH
ncbi:MAG: glycosyltransferase [Mycobacterium sp.]|uniref:glycosyltransferase n=1 Tax=Mycobacterium sp. TaxID=1785 RepID=UPI001EBC3D53|nr:glycosyltransferase [Mycobacterium sp.]MBV8788492.1 glycosyltransferase [Mycobacterium sp.]